MLITVYPLGIYLLTGTLLLAVVLPLLYISYMPLLLAVYRYMAGRFGKSRFAQSLAVGIPSLSSIIDLALSLLVRKVIAFLSIMLFNSVIQCTIVVTNLDENSRSSSRKSWIGVALPTLLAIPYQLAISNLTSLPAKLYLIVDASSIALAYLSTLATLTLVKKTGGTIMLKLLSALLNSLADVREPFERELSKLGTEVYTSAHILGLRTSSGKKLLLTVPYLHFGPLSGTVGSRLIYDLVDALQSRVNIDVILLHGVGGHELDPVGFESRDTIIEKCVQAASDIAKLLDNHETNFSTISKPIRLCGDYICLTRVPLGNVDLVVTSRIVNASDDIPFEVYRKVRDSYTKRKLIMIDAQNGFEGDSEWTLEDIEELRKLLRELSLQEDEHIIKIQASWTMRSVKFPEVGKLGVRALLLRYVKQERSHIDIVLIIFDSNNIRKRIRDTIITELAREDRIVEVLTTDNHEVVSLVGGKGYNVLGEITKLESITNLVRDIVMELEEKLEDVISICYKSVTLRVKVLGEAGFNLIRARLSECIKKAKEFATILIVPQILCILLFLSLVVLTL